MKESIKVTDKLSTVFETRLSMRVVSLTDTGKSSIVRKNQ